MENERYWWLWRVPDGRVFGEPIDHATTGKMFTQKFVLEGKTTTFVMVTVNESITRSEAISFAENVLAGKIHEVFNLDLSKL